ncbi:MAG: uracil-DNA glycosylase family protein [bacterium]
MCLVFMNPTGRNVAAQKTWSGIKAPWIGTKNVWNMFYHLGLIDKKLIEEINKKKPADRSPSFSEEVYKQISKQSIYITNLSKATQIDARPLPDEVFRQYVDLFHEEVARIKPKIIITFGNQVSSVLLQKNIKVGEYRKRHEILQINGKQYKVFPVYYPVGQGTRNIKIAKEDMERILKQ